MAPLKPFFLGVLLTPFRNLYPIHKDLWLFGSDKGLRYGQNSRYLFEYILENDYTIRAYWVTKSRDVFKQLKSAGLPVVYNYSIKGVWFSLTAGLKVMSTWFSDIDYNFYSRRQKIAYLEHGMPIKKIFYDYQPKIAVSGTVFSKIKGKLYKYFTGDYKLEYSCFTPVTSDFYRTILSGAMHNNNVFVCGQPRADALFHLNNIDIRKKINIDENDFVITYMPTHRSYGLGEPSPRIFFDNPVAIDFFKNNRIKVIIKQHPNMLPKYKLKESDVCFLDLSFDSTLDSQELLSITDLLITDFSSCFIDYMVFKKPILFYDYDNYEETDNDLYVSVDQLMDIGYICRDETKLLEKVMETYKSPNTGFESTTIFNIFHDDCSCERCFSKLKDIVWGN